MKEEILAEIKRTAAENGGEPLGAGQFQNETGIRRSDWLGRYWPRWGDALKEAGFEPNTLQAPIDLDNLLAQYAELVRELGHLPAKAELQMKHHNDPAFPHVATVVRKVGYRQAAARMLADYCKRTGGLEDVVAVCEAWKNAQPVETPAARQRDAQRILGHVYLLRSGRHYKIGRSNAAGRRERELAIQLPDKAQIVHKIATDDPAGIEAYWHTRFRDRRGNGEWFALTQQDISDFRRRKYM